MVLTKRRDDLHFPKHEPEPLDDPAAAAAAAPVLVAH
jgi:hypothetical protein